MTDLVFVDTHVFLYAFDEAAEGKRQQAQAWIAACWRLHCGRISTQVLNEFYSSARKRFASVATAGDARAEVRRYQLWKPWQIDHPTIETAWAVEARYGFNYWDALMVAAAQQQGCRWLLTEDLQHGQQIDKLQVVNPFLTRPAELLEPV